jgi:DNA-binding transcriptional LysR family regulator
MVMASLRDLELRHLTALDAVATEGTFGRAAVRLGYTQSAVSQQIAALERLLGGPLFDRPGGPRPVELTPLGKLVLAHARDVIARVDAAGEAVERFLAGDVGRIDVGTFQSVSNVLLPAIVASLRAEYPDLDIRLFEDEDKDEGAGRVLAGDLDVCFTVGERSGALESIVLLDDPFVLVGRRGDLPEGPCPTRRLNGTSLVGYPSGLCQVEIEDGLRACGADPTYVFRSNDNGALLAMVRAGMGWAVMPLLAVDTRDPAIDVRFLEPPVPPRQVCLVWRRDRTLSPVAARLIEIAREVTAELRRLPVPA